MAMLTLVGFYLLLRQCVTIEALTTKTLPSPAAAIEDGRRD
jgi:hypothetical protein